MSVRKLKPVTPAQRFRVVNGFDAITTDKPEKSLLAPKKRSGGRNNTGKMTMRHVGGGHKKRYRIIDFKRNKFDVAAEVLSIEYDPKQKFIYCSCRIYGWREKIYHSAKWLES